MKIATTPVRSVAAIDQELQGLNAKISPAEQALDQAKKTATKLEEQRRAVLIAARVDKDEKAEKALERLTPKVDRAALEVRDSEAVRDEIRVRIKVLTGARLVSVRHEGLRARTRSANQQVALSKEIDGDFAALIEKCGRWLECGLAQYQLSADLGEPITPLPVVSMAWAVNQYFWQLAPMQFTKPSLRNATFTMLAERFADPAPAEQGEERKAS